MTFWSAYIALQLIGLEERQLKMLYKFASQNTTTVLLLVVLIGVFIFMKLNNRDPTVTLDTSLKKKAQHPTLNKKLLFSSPVDSIIFGKWKKKYVCKPLTQSGHVLLIGGSGSGKSSCLAIPTLISNQNTTVFAVDIKGELSFKSADLTNEKNIVFNPRDRHSYGYDPLWKLNATTTADEQILYEVMQTIVFSLVPLNPSEQDPYWTLSARSLLLGFFIYHYKQGYINLIDIIDAIQSLPLQTLLESIEDEVSHDSIEYRMLSQFFELSERTLPSIYSTAMQRISVFTADQYVRYAFKDNFQKMNPSMLEDNNIYLSIPEEHLERYSTILHLIINQTFHELEQRAESSPPILFLIDELPRILSVGAIDSLLDGARTLRSRNVTLFLITQSLEALQIAYTQNQTADLVSNCPYIIILSATSEDTIRKIISWSGKYLSPQYSFQSTSPDARASVTYQEKDIISGMDLMTLAESGDAILISPYGYSRIKKAPYYKDKLFTKLNQEIMSKNKMRLETISSLTSSCSTLESSSKVDLFNQTLSSSTEDALLDWQETLIPFEDLQPEDFDPNNLVFKETE